MSSMEPATKFSDTSDDGTVQNALMKTAIEPVGPIPVANRKDFVQSTNLRPPSRRSNFSTELQALKDTIQVLFTECKAPLRRSQPKESCNQPKESSMLLGLLPEIREMIWKELVQGDYVTLMVKENRKYENCLKNRGFWWQSREWIHRGEIKIQDRPDCEVKIRRTYHGISISMLLACKQMHREIIDIYFRRAIVELNPVLPYCFEPLAPSFDLLKPKATMGILAHVRFVSTSLKLDNEAPWDFMVEETSWFFRLLRCCPQLRRIQIQANFSHHFDPHPANPSTLCDQAQEKMQLLASRAAELLPTQPNIIKGPRPLSLKNPTKDCTCGQHGATCRCTWVVAFAFQPEKDSFAQTDFHTPGEADWSNQILFTRPWRRHHKGVTLNRLETQFLNPPMSAPKTMLEMEDTRDLPKDFSLDHLRAAETYTPKQTLRKRWRNDWVYRVMFKSSAFRPLEHSDLISWFSEADF